MGEFVSSGVCNLGKSVNKWKTVKYKLIDRNVRSSYAATLEGRNALFKPLLCSDTFIALPMAVSITRESSGDVM